MTSTNVLLTFLNNNPFYFGSQTVTVQTNTPVFGFTKTAKSRFDHLLVTGLNKISSLAHLIRISEEMVLYNPPVKLLNDFVLVNKV